MDHVLIDTDVILDFFFDRQPFAESASEVFSLCESGHVIGYTTPVIICNVYYLLRKIAKHEAIIAKLKQLLEIVGIIDMNREVVLKALDSKFKDIEDALQNFSASLNGDINIILTRNVKDFSKSDIAVMTPEMFVRNFSAGN